jgi:hypothetical protein
MNEYYYDLSDEELETYYTNLDKSKSTKEHIAEVEKEIEEREL